MEHSTTKKFYILVAYGGEYDGRWETHLIGSFDKALLEQFILDEPARLERAIAYNESLNEFISQWWDANKVAYEETVPFLHLGPGLSVEALTEMRAEIKKTNDRITKQNIAVRVRLKVAGDVAVEAYKAEHPFDELLITYDDDHHFSIYEIDVLE